jgi:hypothetical protein
MRTGVKDVLTRFVGRTPDKCSGAQRSGDDAERQYTACESWVWESYSHGWCGRNGPHDACMLAVIVDMLFAHVSVWGIFEIFYFFSRLGVNGEILDLNRGPPAGKGGGGLPRGSPTRINSSGSHSPQGPLEGRYGTFGAPLGRSPGQRASPTQKARFEEWKPELPGWKPALGHPGADQETRLSFPGQARQHRAQARPRAATRIDARRVETRQRLPAREPAWSPQVSRRALRSGG